MLNAVEKISFLVNRLLMVVGAMALLLLMLLPTANVLLRMGGMPFKGSYEISGFLGAVITALALGDTQRRKDHVAVDLFDRHFPASVNRVLDGIRYAVCVVFFSLVAWRVFLWGSTLARKGEVSETLKMVFHPFVYCVAFGFVMMVVVLLLDFIRVFIPRHQEHEL